METLELVNGYDRKKNPERARYRRMTVFEAKRLKYGQRVPCLANDGTARECRVSGAPKTWKTRPGDVRVPVKYGMHENAYAEAYGGGEGDPVSLLLVRLDETGGAS
jgi:hypothetical protein